MKTLEADIRCFKLQQAMQVLTLEVLLKTIMDQSLHVVRHCNIEKIASPLQGTNIASIHDHSESQSESLFGVSYEQTSSCRQGTLRITACWESLYMSRKAACSFSTAASVQPSACLCTVFGIMLLGWLGTEGTIFRGLIAFTCLLLPAACAYRDK